MNCTPEKAALSGLLCAILLTAMTPLALGQSATGDADRPLLVADASKTSTPTTVMVFNPPKRGAPARRQGGGTRSDNTATVSVLAPKSVGLTTRPQPTLYWFVSDSVDRTVVVTVTDEDSIDPLLERTIAAPDKPGVQALDLKSFGIELEPGKPYEWEVALVDASGDRSRDTYARGAIERVEAPPGLSAELDGRSRAEKARALAAAGIWYDAVDELSRGIASAPAESSLQADRRSLLAQVELSEVAAYER